MDRIEDGMMDCDESESDLFREMIDLTILGSEPFSHTSPHTLGTKRRQRVAKKPYRMAMVLISHPTNGLNP